MSARTAVVSELLIECVDGGASVSFMAPLSRAKADAFWQHVAEGVAAGEHLRLPPSLQWLLAEGRSGSATKDSE